MPNNTCIVAQLSVVACIVAKLPNRTFTVALLCVAKGPRKVDKAEPSGMLWTQIRRRGEFPTY